MLNYGTFDVTGFYTANYRYTASLMTEDKNIYTKQCVVNERRIIINGVEVSPRQIPLELKIEFLGFGSINDKQILGYEFVIGSTNETIYIYDTQEFIDIYEKMLGRFDEN